MLYCVAKSRYCVIRYAAVRLTYVLRIGRCDWVSRYLPFQVTHSPYEIPGGNTSPYVNPSDPKERMIINAMVSVEP